MVWKPSTPWVANSTSPRADQSYKNGGRPAGGGGSFSDADYPATPAYNETGAVFFDSAASGLNNGTSWTDAYTDITTALTDLCGKPAGAMLTCRGTISIPAGGIALSGIGGGAGNSSNWYVFRADPMNGCDITGASARGIEFGGGQSYWVIDGFNQTGGGTIFSYNPGFSSTGGINHFTFRNLTGAMSVGGDNVATVMMDSNGADYIGVFNSTLTGPGTGAHGNTACVYMSRTPHFRIMNNTLNNAPKGIYWKHFDATSWGGANSGYVMSNYVYGCPESRLAVTDTLIENNIFDCQLSIQADGGGDASDSNNIINHNTITGDLLLSDDSPASNNTVTNNILTGGFNPNPYSTQNYSNTSDYNLLTDGVGYEYWNQSTFSVATYKSQSGLDVNSITGSPTYVGGANPTTPSGFALGNGSLGFLAANDGKDMGADVSNVGA